MKPVKAIGFIDAGIFHYSILFSAGKDLTEIGRWLKVRPDWKAAIDNKGEVIQSDFAKATHISHRIQNKEYHYLFIYLKRPFGFKDDDMSTLAHECLHICQFLFAELNIDALKEIECQAYLLSHLMEQCLTLLRQAQGKRK